MPLFDRLLGRDDALAEVEAKLSVHLFDALLAEFARGRVDGPTAQAIISASSGQSLDPAGVAEAQSLLATFGGSLTAKLARAKEVNDVLMLGELGAVGYQTPVQVMQRLGV